MKDVVIIDGFRTPYAKAGTAFKDVHPVDLGAAIVKETVARTGIDRESLDEVIVGNAGMPADAANIARVIALRAGMPERIPAYSVQHNCASGMQAAASAYMQILPGMNDIVPAAGVCCTTTTSGRSLNRSTTICGNASSSSQMLVA